MRRLMSVMLGSACLWLTASAANSDGQEKIGAPGKTSCGCDAKASPQRVVVDVQTSHRCVPWLHAHKPRTTGTVQTVPYLVYPTYAQPTTYAVMPYAVQPYVVQPYAVQPYAMQPYSVSPGPVQLYIAGPSGRPDGASPFAGDGKGEAKDVNAALRKINASLNDLITIADKHTDVLVDHKSRLERIETFLKLKFPGEFPK